MVAVPGTGLAEPLDLDLELCVAAKLDGSLGVDGEGAGLPGLVIIGTSGDDTLAGGPLPDLICGLGGNDTINGGGGDDRIEGGDGDDLLYGGVGNDTLIGGPGDDTGFGQPGDVVQCERCKAEATGKQGPEAAVRPGAAPSADHAESGSGRHRLRSGNCPWRS